LPIIHRWRHRVWSSPALAAVALAAEDAVLLRRLRPADRVGDEGDPVRAPRVAAVAVQAHDQLGVLADRRRVVAARLDDGLAPEQAERAGDDQQHVDPRPAGTAGEERAQVLDDLHVHERALRGPDLLQPAALEQRAVDDPHDPAGRDRLGLRLERPHEPGERGWVEQRVGVDRAEQRIRRVADAAVQRVRLAAVLLVDHEQAVVERSRVDGVDRLGRQVRAWDALDLDEPEGLLQRRERAVVRPVVDDHHLQLAVVRREQ
jgi:hypothetical protein